MATAGVGAFVDFECELVVPDIVRLLPSDELNQALDFVESFAGLGPLLGKGAEGLPTTEETAGMRKFAHMMKSDDLVIVGTDDESDWSCASTLKRTCLCDSPSDLNGSFRVTGKVAGRVRSGEYKLLLGLPGMSLLPREERRAMEKKRPADDERDMYLEGPARMIDVLAIYR